MQKIMRKKNKIKKIHEPFLGFCITGGQRSKIHHICSISSILGGHPINTKCALFYYTVNKVKF